MSVVRIVAGYKPRMTKMKEQHGDEYIEFSVSNLHTVCGRGGRRSDAYLV